MKKIFPLIGLVAFMTAASQAQYGPDYNNILMLKGADTLSMAWTGGMNNPQFSEADPAQFILINSNYFNIDVGNYSAPQLYDINGDGLLDLLIG